MIEVDGLNQKPTSVLLIRGRSSGTPVPSPGLNSLPHFQQKKLTKEKPGITRKQVIYLTKSNILDWQGSCRSKLACFCGRTQHFAKCSSLACVQYGFWCLTPSRSNLRLRIPQTCTKIFTLQCPSPTAKLNCSLSGFTLLGEFLTNCNTEYIIFVPLICT